MTLFDLDPVVCEHGRTASERCPHCELAREPASPQNEPQAPYVAGSRTSFEASQAIKPDRARLKERVYQVIQGFGPISDEFGAALCAMNPSTWRPRRIELQREGRVEKAGTTLTQAGRKAVAWVVSTSSDQG